LRRGVVSSPAGPIATSIGGAVAFAGSIHRAVDDDSLALFTVIVRSVGT
jgi:hypothetical protein